MKSRKGFTLVELMVVILIVGILAAVAVPIMRGRIDSAKWSEANAAAGSIRTAVRAYVAEKGPSFTYTGIETTLDTAACYSALGFSAADLSGAYFNQADYTISGVNATTGTCTVTVVSSHSEGPSGTGTLAASGTWAVN
jgi:prepilin-type N-terminal cleavage/methylation domain-containing protein